MSTVDEILHVWYLAPIVTMIIGIDEAQTGSEGGTPLEDTLGASTL